MAEICARINNMSNKSIIFVEVSKFILHTNMCTSYPLTVGIQAFSIYTCMCVFISQFNTEYSELKVHVHPH